MSGAYGTSPIKRRRRRSAAEMDVIRTAIHDELAADRPMTVRQLFYRLTTTGVIEKTEAEYKGTVCRLTAEMRRAGDIPYHWLADATRWMRKPKTFSSVEDALRRTASTYRRALWDDAPTAVEIWLEKEALAGVLVDVTDEWDVPLMVTRGCPSMSFLYSAAEMIADRERSGQRTQSYYFGDYDPTGVDIDRQIVQGIGECLDGLAAYDEPDFVRVGVRPDQISDYNLPTRPTKKTDTRSKNFKGESVELDAIKPEDLRELATAAIERHVDHHRLDVLRTYEDEERRQMEEIAATLGGRS